MPTARAKTIDVLSRVQQGIRRAVNAAADGNNLVSRSEQKTLSDPLLNDVANDLRAAGGPGARVYKAALVETAVDAVEALLASVNQPSGSGAAFVSANEVKAALAANPVVGARVAKAYQLITGRKVTPDAAPPPGVTGQLGHLDLTAVRLGAIADHARRVASSGDMMTGSIPPGHYVVLPVLAGDASVPQGRSYSVYLPHDGFSDPNTGERMYLEATDAQGLVWTASFDVPV